MAAECVWPRNDKIVHIEKLLICCKKDSKLTQVSQSVIKLGGEWMRFFTQGYFVHPGWVEPVVHALCLKHGMFTVGLRSGKRVPLGPELKNVPPGVEPGYPN